MRSENDRMEVSGLARNQQIAVEIARGEVRWLCEIGRLRGLSHKRFQRRAPNTARRALRSAGLSGRPLRRPSRRGGHGLFFVAGLLQSLADAEAARPLARRELLEA